MRLGEIVSERTRRQIDDLLTRVESVKLARERAVGRDVDAWMAKLGLLG